MGLTVVPQDTRRRAWPSARLVRRTLLGLSAGGVVALLWLLTWPPTAVPDRSDAVVVLSGPSARLDRGIELVEQGIAPTLVVSNGERPGWSRGNELCAGTAPFDVLCFRPRPQRTVGEARAIAAMVAEHGWQHVTVVTSPSHVARSRVLVEQCTHATVAMATHDTELADRLRPATLLREAVALVASATVDRAC